MTIVKARFPKRRVGTNATYINEDEILEQVEVLLAEKPTEGTKKTSPTPRVMTQIWQQKTQARIHN